MPHDPPLLNPVPASALHVLSSRPGINYTSDGATSPTVISIPPWEPEIPAGRDSAHGHDTVDSSGHRDSFSSSSGSSFADTTSPTASRVTGTIMSLPTPVDADRDDTPWDLVAYHVPWGAAYEGYNAGTFPGPDGACTFLRSPTPTKQKKTAQACLKCRDRKAKCSGTRPSCLRCSSRGYFCVYGPPPNSDPSSPWSSFLRTPLAASNARPRPLKLKGPTLRRLRLRPSGVGESVTSPSSAGESPGVEHVFNATVVSNAGSGDWELGITSGGSCSSGTGGGEPTQPISPLDPPASASSTSSIAASLDQGALSRGFSAVRGRGHTFSGSFPAPHYGGSSAVPADYRFPPPPPLREHSQMIPNAHPQLQVLRYSTSMPQLSHPRADPEVPATGAAVGLADWFTSDGLQPMFGNTPLFDLLYPQQPLATSSEPPLFSPQSYTGSFDNSDQFIPEAYQIVEQSFPPTES